MVLFLFVIMLLNLDDEETLFGKVRIKYIASTLFGIVVLSLIVYSFGSFTGTLPEIDPDMAYAGTVEALGDVLYTDYLFAFEMTAILLTAAVVGALMIAQFKPNNKSDAQE
jgi:NADH-quinone oxidoreductase subunit J